MKLPVLSSFLAQCCCVIVWTRYLHSTPVTCEVFHFTWNIASKQVTVTFGIWVTQPTITATAPGVYGSTFSHSCTVDSTAGYLYYKAVKVGRVNFCGYVLRFLVAKSQFPLVSITPRPRFSLTSACQGVSMMLTLWTAALHHLDTFLN